VRLIRQLLTESLLLALIGTTLGTASAPVVARLLVVTFATQGGSVAPPIDTTPDWTVFAFTAALAIFATVMTGVMPALRSTADGFESGLREGSAKLRGADRRRLWPRVLMGVEIALALVLVSGASLLGVSLVKLHQQPLGFEPKNLVYLPLDMEKQSKQGPALVAVNREIVGEIRKLPGVSSASLSEVMPLSGNWNTNSASSKRAKLSKVWLNRIAPDYFETMRQPFLAGRDVRWSDSSAELVAILNQSAAKKLFPGESAVGQRISLDDSGVGKIEVIGVVADSKYARIRDEAPPTMYTPVYWGQQPKASYILVVRSAATTNVQTTALISSSQAVVRRIAPDIPAPAAVTMEQTLAESLATERMMSTLALFFGGLALLITGIGLYGTLAFTTERRTGEIGIRLALGAQPRNVISMVCSENGAITLAGCVAGTAVSLAASKLVSSFLYGVSARDPMIFALATLVLLLVAAAASLVPALKAARIAPQVAIRYE
jgi:predicted permease